MTVVLPDVRCPDDLIKELDELEKYINRNVKVNCGFGDKDIKPDQYPYIQIIPALTMNLHRQDKKSVMLRFPVDLKIMVSRDNELEALEVFQRLLKKINQFNEFRNHSIGEDIEPEYLESVYALRVPFILNLVIQDRS